jgi:hypothetical protein
MREQFYNHVFEVLLKNNFVQNEDVWIKEQLFQQPGQVMSINGRRFEQPGEVIKITHKVVTGLDGSVSNTDDTNEKPLTVIHFSIRQGDYELDESGVGIGFYYDELQEFDNVFTQIFRLNN